MRILLVKLTSLGDILFSLALASDIKRSRPDIEIDWAVDEMFRDLVSNSRAISKVWSLPFRQLSQQRKIGAFWKILSTLCKLRLEKYDLVIDLQGMIKSSVVALSADSSVRWTYIKNQMAEPLLHRYFEKCFAISKAVHAVDNYRAIGAEIFGYSLEGKPTFDFFCHVIPFGLPQFYAQAPYLNGRKYILFIPFTSKATKCIPSAYWNPISKLLTFLYPDCEVVFLAGNAEERRLVENYSQTDQIFKSSPPLSLAQACFVLRHAYAVVGADTGLTYIAAASRVATIAVYVRTNLVVLDPNRWAPAAAAVHIEDSFWIDRIGTLLPGLISRSMPQRALPALT